MLTTTSTTEVEFRSCFEATSHGVWLKSFIVGLRIMDSNFRRLRIYCINFATVFMTKNNKSSSWSKHINIKYLAIRECIKEKKVVTEYISTDLMFVDPLTRGMPPFKFKDHVERMRLGFIMWFVLKLYLCYDIFLYYFYSCKHLFIWEILLMLGLKMNIRFIL